MNETQPPGGMHSFPGTHYHAPWRLVTWRPQGTLDDVLLDQIIQFVEAEERVLEGSFNRFIDLSALKEIRLKIGHVFQIAAHRRDAVAGHESVKSAIYAETTVGFGIARMYEYLLKDSTIVVRALRDLAGAADWLGVPVGILRQEPPALSPSHAQAPPP